MSFETSDEIHTAEDLLQFLLRIPAALRPQLGLQLTVQDGKLGFEAPLRVEAYQVYETQGNEERGLRLSPVSDGPSA